MSLARCLHLVNAKGTNRLDQVFEQFRIETHWSCRLGRSRFEGCWSEKRSGEAVKGSSQVLRGPASVRRWSAGANRAPTSGYEVWRGLVEVKRRSR
ncbi:hypothetical protein RHGRI_015122 [Rhododendron griersonianum]|uniref:Uncharacterized protein n=1 Tax=Rhododendron griersonianum TaxID=479676 RepID=A0AAV6KC26_9ERIC|nr:hypothetical protein RHGRI_015122 [Rhododendron griersonianum]